jgi:hypothetical protein
MLTCDVVFIAAVIRVVKAALEGTPYSQRIDPEVIILLVT